MLKVLGTILLLSNLAFAGFDFDGTKKSDPISLKVITNEVETHELDLLEYKIIPVNSVRNNTVFSGFFTCFRKHDCVINHLIKVNYILTTLNISFSDIDENSKFMLTKVRAIEYINSLLVKHLYNNFVISDTELSEEIFLNENIRKGS